MKRMSLQWRLTCITTLCIAIICGCLTMFVYKNGVHYIDSLQDAVESQGDEKGNKSDEIYISIPDDKWDEFADEFSVQVYNNKADYKRNSLIITVLLALLGGVVTYFISGHALRPIREFSDKIEEVQAQNLSDSRIEENNVKELNQLGISYNKMLERLSEAFEIQRQFTANAAHELRTPLSLMQLQLDLYNATRHPGNDADTIQTIKIPRHEDNKEVTHPSHFVVPKIVSENSLAVLLELAGVHPKDFATRTPIKLQRHRTVSTVCNGRFRTDLGHEINICAWQFLILEKPSATT